MAEINVAQTAITFLFTLLSGIIIGIIVEHLRLKRSFKVERIKRLAPSLETCCPIVERISDDSTYAAKILKRGRKIESDLGSQVHKVYVGLQQYQDWHSLFEQKGMKYELEAVDTELHDRLVGLFTYARLASKHGEDYVSQNLNGIKEASLVSRKKLKFVLKG